MIPNQAIFEKLQPIIVDAINFMEINRVKPEAYFSKDLRARDVDIVDIVQKVEMEFNIEIPEDDEHILINGTVQDAVNYIAAKVEAAQ